jgi:hypothetical protein
MIYQVLINQSIMKVEHRFPRTFIIDFHVRPHLACTAPVPGHGHVSSLLTLPIVQMYNNKSYFGADPAPMVRNLKMTLMHDFCSKVLRFLAEAPN